MGLLNLKKYKYRGLWESEEITAGYLYSTSNQIALKELKKRNIATLDLKEVKFSIKKLDRKEVILFVEFLKNYLNSGLSLYESLQKISNNADSEGINFFCLNLINYLNHGYSLSLALDKNKGIIPDFLLYNLKSIDFGINIEDRLDSIIKYLNFQKELSEKLQAVFVYPLIVIGIAFLLLNLSLLFFIPNFLSIVKDVGGNLTTYSKFLLLISTYYKKYFLFLMMIFLIILIIARKYMKESIVSTFYKIPYISVWFLRLENFKFAMLLEQFLKSGLGLFESLSIIGRNTTSQAIKKELIEVLNSLNRGYDLKTSFGKSEFFNKGLVRIFSFEDKGGVLQALDKKVKNERRFFSRSLELLPKYLEPIVLLIIGFIVLAIVLSILIPFFNIINEINF